MKHRSRVRRLAEAKVAELEKCIADLERRVRGAKADQKNPLSRVYTSPIEGHANLATTTARELENTQGDLTILRQVASGHLDLRGEKEMRKELPKWLRMRETAVRIIAGMQSRLASIERAKQLLR